jgi:hypothetical protein
MSLRPPRFAAFSTSTTSARFKPDRPATDFGAGEQNSPNAITKEKAAEIAADFVMTCPSWRLDTHEFRTTPVPFGLVCFLDTIKGPLRKMFLVVLLLDGTVVEPMVENQF